MKNSILIALLLFAFSCKNTSEDQAAGQVTESEEKIVEKRDEFTITKIKPTETQNTVRTGEVRAAYFSATVYTGSTDYFFKDDNGQTIKIRQSNDTESQTLLLPEGMLIKKTGENLPSENPTMKGKIFLLTFDDTGNVQSVKLAE